MCCEILKNAQLPVKFVYRHIFEYFGNDCLLVCLLVVQSILRRFAMTGRKDRTGGSASNNSYENSSSDAEESENNDERNWGRKSSNGGSYLILTFTTMK
ncbi:hypothetical protein TNCT_716301 [Trichonephila clavata]|uniref:Uncharacterized protein n=1 Tax=Trichonephila clavata TaxID=2740835 RepID=A0A8X6IGF4_TRICU|nr:hypothetical protein TNCT_716301 [Trichonephila clavata]